MDNEWTVTLETKGVRYILRGVDGGRCKLSVTSPVTVGADVAVREREIVATLVARATKITREVVV